MARRSGEEQPRAARRTPIPLSTPPLLLTAARWERIAPLLPRPKEHGRPMVDSYPLLAGILWIMGTGAAWRELPAEYGHWHTAYTRYRDWQRSGLWTQILAILAAPDSSDAL